MLLLCSSRWNTFPFKMFENIKTFLSCNSDYDEIAHIEQNQTPKWTSLFYWKINLVTILAMYIVYPGDVRTYLQSKPVISLCVRASLCGLDRESTRFCAMSEKPTGTHKYRDKQTWLILLEQLLLSICHNICTLKVTDKLRPIFHKFYWRLNYGHAVNMILLDELWTRSPINWMRSGKELGWGEGGRRVGHSWVIYVMVI